MTAINQIDDFTPASEGASGPAAPRGVDVAAEKHPRTVRLFCVSPICRAMSGG